VQVAPIKPKLKPPGNKRLKLKYEILLSTSAFKINLRRYNSARYVQRCEHYRRDVQMVDMAGRCRLSLSNSR